MESDILANARMDLGATIEGQFSPGDWEQILKTARHSLTANMQRGLPEEEAWREVIRDFHRRHYWGFKPNYRAPAKKRNLGIQLVWLTFNSLVTIKIAVLWFGQIYSRSEEPADKWIFFLVLFLAVANLGYFLWRHRAYDHTEKH